MFSKIFLPHHTLFLLFWNFYNINTSSLVIAHIRICSYFYNWFFLIFCSDLLKFSILLSSNPLIFFVCHLYFILEPIDWMFYSNYCSFCLKIFHLVLLYCLFTKTSCFPICLKRILNPCFKFFVKEVHHICFLGFYAFWLSFLIWIVISLFLI